MDIVPWTLAHGLKPSHARKHTHWRGHLNGVTSLLRARGLLLLAPLTQL